MQCPGDTFLGVQPTLVKPAHFVEGHGTPGTEPSPQLPPLPAEGDHTGQAGGAPGLSKHGLGPR